MWLVGGLTEHLQNGKEARDFILMEAGTTEAVRNAVQSVGAGRWERATQQAAGVRRVPQ